MAERVDARGQGSSPGSSSGVFTKPSPQSRKVNRPIHSETSRQLFSILGLPTTASFDDISSQSSVQDKDVGNAPESPLNTNISPVGAIKKSPAWTSPSSSSYKLRSSASALNSSPLSGQPSGTMIMTTTPPRNPGSEEKKRQTGTSRVVSDGTGWRTFFRSPDMIDGHSPSGSKSKSAISANGNTSSPRNNADEEVDEIGDDTAETDELEETQTMDPELMTLDSALDRRVMLFPESPTRASLLGNVGANPFAGPARGLKGRSYHRTLSRPSELAGQTNGLSKKDFDSQETIVPGDYQRQQLQPGSSSLLLSLSNPPSSRIWEPVDWENFSPHEEMPTVHEGSMMLPLPPSPRRISRPDPILTTTSNGSTSTSGPHAYWKLFDHIPRHDQGPLSASTNSTTSTWVDTSFSGNTSTSTPASATASDGIATTHLIQNFTGFNLPGVNSSEPEYDSDEAEGGPSIFPVVDTRRRSSEASGPFSHVSPADLHTPAGPIEIVVDDEGVAGMTEESEEGRASASGPIRSIRWSTRERKTVEPFTYPSPSPAEQSTSRTTKRGKRTKASSATSTANNAIETSLLKPVRPPGDRGQGRKPSSSLASPEPDSAADGTDPRDPEALSAKKARRREINRKSARTLREKRKAELESAWIVVDKLREQVRILTEEAKREREWRFVCQNELANRGVDLATLGMDTDNAPVNLTQESTISSMMQVDSASESEEDELRA